MANPLLLASLFSLAPGLLSRLFGGDPQKRLREEIARLTSPGNVGRATSQWYQQALQSPAFSQAQGGIAAGANQAAANLAASLGARGIGTTGTGAALSSMIPSIVGGQQAGLRTQAYGFAQNQAQQQIQAAINALLGTQGPSQSSQFFAGGLEALGPLLQMWLKSRFPQTAGQPAPG